MRVERTRGARKTLQRVTLEPAVLLLRATSRDIFRYLAVKEGDFHCISLYIDLYLYDDGVSSTFLYAWNCKHHKRLGLESNVLLID